MPDEPKKKIRKNREVTNREMDPLKARVEAIEDALIRDDAKITALIDAVRGILASLPPDSDAISVEQFDRLFDK